MLIRFDAMYGSRLMNCWLPAETWVEALMKAGHIDPSLTVNTRKFNAAFGKSTSFGSVMSRFDGSNQTGVFHVRYSHQQFYYFTEEGKQAVYPVPLNRAWKEKVMEYASSVLVIPSTRARPGGSFDPAPAVIAAATVRGSNADSNEDHEGQPSPSKRHRTNTTTISSHSRSYWPCSPEAYHLFRPTNKIK